jgi:subtilase-type serine protease
LWLWASCYSLLFFTFCAASSFTIDGAAAPSDAAKVNTGLKLDVTDRTALFGFFDGVFSDQGQSYAGTGGVKILW